MSKESIKRQIENEKKSIEHNKKDIERYKSDIAKIKENKKKDIESINNKLKNAKHVSQRDGLKKQKVRVSDSATNGIKSKNNDIARKKLHIDKFKAKIAKLREDLKKAK